MGASANDGRWILLLILLPAVLSKGFNIYSLRAPRTYSLLSDDIIVLYRVPAKSSGLRIQLLETTASGDRPLVKKEVPHDTTEGKLVFPCGLVSKAGRIAFQLETIQDGAVLARTDPVDVTWPEIHVHVPLLVETYSSEAVVQVELAALACAPRKSVGYKVLAELLFVGPSLPSSAEGSSWFYGTVVFGQEIEGWLEQGVYDIRLECSVFYRAGYYKVRIRTSTNTILAESEDIHSLWSHRYLINVPQATISPCVDAVIVSYNYPRCITDYDRIRVYGRPSAPAKRARQQQQLEYLFESRVERGKYSVKLPCDMFHPGYREFCFTYFSTAENGAVFEMKSVCRPYAFDPGGLGPQWSDWSPWSPCSTTCESGLQSRYRICSLPNESVEKSACEGTSMDSRLCVESSCPETSSAATTAMPEHLAVCPCGCVVNVSTPGVLEAYVSDINCDHSSVVWLLQSWPNDGEGIVFEFVDVVLEPVRQWLTIREGSSAVGALLAVVTSNSPYPLLESRQTVMRIELHSLNHTGNQEAGFKGEFSKKEVTPRSLAVLDAPGENPLHSLSAVHLSMAVLASLVAVATVVLFVVHQVRSAINRKRLSEGRSSESLFSLAAPLEDKVVRYTRVKLLTATTSTSEISLSPLPVRRKPKCSSPEEILQNSFLFRSISSVCTASPPDSPRPVLRKLLPFSPPTDRKLPVAAVSPQLKKKGSALYCSDSNDSQEDKLGRLSPIHFRKKFQDKNLRYIQRESNVPLTASVSQFSINASEDGLEYDYYDYNYPGSYFCADPALMEWPPFITTQPQDDLPMQQFTPSPPPSEEVKSTES